MTSNDNDLDTGHDDEHELVDGSIDAWVWQLLLLINPGDEEMALHQFAEYRDAVSPWDEDEAVQMDVLRRVIDWRSGFYVDANDTRALVQAIDELCLRWNITIDWGGDADDDEYHEADIDAASLFSMAYDRLLEHGYTLWAWEAGDGGYAGWMTLKRDNESLREVATSLGINMRLGNEVT